MKILAKDKYKKGVGIMRDNQAKLYHYSNRDIQGKIKPTFFGDNSYTDNDKKTSIIKRAFYYLGKHRAEYLLQYSKYLYITKLNKRQLYNLDIDKAKLKNRFKIRGLDIVNITKLLKYIKKRYIGIIYSGNIVVIFKDLKYIRKIKRS